MFVSMSLLTAKAITVCNLFAQFQRSLFSCNTISAADRRNVEIVSFSRHQLNDPLINFAVATRVDLLTIRTLARQSHVLVTLHNNLIVFAEHVMKVDANWRVHLRHIRTRLLSASSPVADCDASSIFIIVLYNIVILSHCFFL